MSGAALQEVVLGVLVVVAAGLLVPAGVAKLRAPRIAREALGLPLAADPLVRVIGVGELALAGAVLSTAAPAAVGLLAVTYVVFTVVAARQRSRGASCGCFGASDAPTGWHHVLLDGVAAASAAVAAAVGVPSAVGLAAGSPVAGVAVIVAGVVAVASAQLLITALPDLAAARRTAGGAS